MNNGTHAPLVTPSDAHDQNLLSNVRPSDWVNPAPASRYNLVVIGAGPAGLIAAAGAAGLGTKVALIEKHLLGGDCLNVGCVPSKALLRAARACADVRDAGQYGISVPPGSRADFPKIMERMRKLRSELSRHDAARRYQQLGVDVFIGRGQFIGPETVEVEGKELHFRKALIATGARAAVLPIPGLAESGVLTNESVFSLTQLPRRLAVIGAGAIGCELAQAFCRFGSHVTLFEAETTILPREDAEAAAILSRQLIRDGIQIVCGARIERIELTSGGKRIHLTNSGLAHAQEVDAVLVGIGRAPNVEGLNLEAAGVEHTKDGVAVNDYLKTANPRILAAGDVCSAHKFTHAADAMARIALQNALFGGRKRISALTIPSCIFTDPEIARVGMDERQAQHSGVALQTLVQRFDDVDRAVLDGETEGMVKLHVRAGTDRIVGATFVARHAGEMISEITTAMAGGMGLAKLAGVIHPYPTQAEAIKKVADSYNRTRLTPFVKSVLKRWFRLSG